MAAFRHYPTLYTIRLRKSRWWFSIPIIGNVIIFIGCILYISRAYNALKDWYLHLFPCIYKAWEWPQAFFTMAVKNAGNNYAIVGIALSLLLCMYFCRRFLNMKEHQTFEYHILRIDALYIIALILFGFFIWLYGMLICYPGYDEVFSAINCAGIHPFQTASYYMLPNNHIFFNLLNSIIGAFTTDKLFTGRLICGGAFMALIPLLYYWLKSQIASRPYAAVFCALMMLQFPVWGFSFQGRGYSLYLLCAWCSFIALQRFLQTGSRLSLSVHVIAIIIGFWTIPSFLFWEFALVAYICLTMLVKRKIYWALIRSQFIAGISVFLVFLPVLLFSGKAAILENRYVRADKVSFKEYWPTFYNAFHSAIQYCFSGFVDAYNLSYMILFFLPIPILFFIRKTPAARVIGFFIIMWLVFCVLELQMQRFPFMRNLIAHASMTLATLLLAGHALLQQVFKGKWRTIKFAATTLGCIAFAVHFARFNRDHVHDSLYFYNADTRYRTLHSAILTLPANARVGLSDEGFYWEYLCQRRGLIASMCLGPQATHYIKMETEKLPYYLMGRVEKIKQADEYEIYRLK